MSLQAIECAAGLIPAGKMVVLDSNMKAIQYDEKEHTLSDVIGLSYPKSSTSGRCAANIDGFSFLDNDYWAWTETLQYAYDEFDQLIPNPNYDPTFNPLNDNNYCIVCVAGLAPFDKTNAAPPTSYRKVRTGVSYDLYIVR